MFLQEFYMNLLELLSSDSTYVKSSKLTCIVLNFLRNAVCHDLVMNMHCLPCVSDFLICLLSFVLSHCVVYRTLRIERPFIGLEQCKSLVVINGYT